MSTIYFATTNQWKYLQGRDYLSRLGIVVEQAKIELPESRSEDVLEVARGKAAYAWEKLRQPVFVIDGAFHIMALQGFPKTFVKFSEKYIGARGVLRLMEGGDDRSYEWPNVLYYRDEDGERYFTGYIRGTIITEAPESEANGFDLIQLPAGYSKTFSQMNEDDLRHFERNVWQPVIFQDFAHWVKTK